MGVRRSQSKSLLPTPTPCGTFIKVTCSVFQFLSEVSAVGIIDKEAEAER